MNPSYLHLKICEGCGRLWARSHAVTGVYCRKCTIQFAQFPAPRSRKQKGRPRKGAHAAFAMTNPGGGQ